MFPNNFVYTDKANPPDADPFDSLDVVYREGAARSEQIIRRLPLLAANDLLEHGDGLPPVA